MKFALLPHIRPELARAIRGTTDSEWVYALLLSQLPDPYGDFAAQDIARGVEATLRVLAEVRRELGIDTFSPMNLFLSDGNDIVVACYTFDLGRYEGSATTTTRRTRRRSASGTRRATRTASTTASGGWSARPTTPAPCIIASEPLTRDHGTWHAVPMQHLVYVRRAGDAASWTTGDAAVGPTVEVVPLDVG